MGEESSREGQSDVTGEGFALASCGAVGDGDWEPQAGECRWSPEARKDNATEPTWNPQTRMRTC